MEGSHVFSNWLLTAGAKILVRWPYNDSQSGMWIFKRHIPDHLYVRSSGMPFSQEIKIETYVRGFKWAKMPIDYRARAGQVQRNTIGDGIGNILQLFKNRLQLGLRVVKADVDKISRQWVQMDATRDYKYANEWKKAALIQ